MKSTFISVAHVLFICLFSGLLLLCSCGKEDAFPRPKGFPRIDLPEKAYVSFEHEPCPFTFEYPSFGKIIRSKEDSCSFDIYFRDFNFYWHITYRNIPETGESRSFHDEDYRRLVMKHIIKLSHLNELPLEGPSGTGIMYELYGNVGAPAKLIYGDSTEVIMTSFYFSEVIKQDSLKPLINYVKEDLRHMTQTLRWKRKFPEK